LITNCSKKFWQFKRKYVSLLVMKHNDIIRQRNRLLGGLPDLAALLRGSLLQRTIRHRQGCPKCDRGQGHPVWVLAIGYPKGVIRHLSLRQQQVPQLRRYLKNYYQLKRTLEQICELNQQLLRPEDDQPKPSRRRTRD
jgi:hypothetical protein